MGSGSWIAFAVLGVMACSRPVVASLDATGGGYTISYPSAHARILIAEPGFDVQTADPHRPFYALTNQRTGLDLVLRFERPTECKSSHECRDLALLRLRESKPELKQAESGEIGAISYFEYTDPPHGGLDLRQRHLHAHFVSSELWVQMELTKVQYEENDRELFARAVRATRIDPM